MNKIVVFVLSLCVGVNCASAAQMEQQGKKVDVPVCGGFQGLKYSADQWCDYPHGAICGAVDHFGVCRPRPDVCTAEFIPVCGCNGKSYGNAYEATADGTDVAYNGLACLPQLNLTKWGSTARA